MKGCWAIAVLALGVVAQTEAQSLGELAKQEKKRRQAVSDPKTRTITEDDLRGGPKASPAASPEARSGSAAAKARTDQEPLTETDRRRLEALANIAARFERLVDDGNSLIYTARLYNQTNCTSQPQPAECTAMQQSLDSLACSVGRSLDDVEEIARTGFLPPGLVREAREATGLDGQLWDTIRGLSRSHCAGR
jgi:hypothetical protein